jgi:hypothetical protein
MSPLIRWSQVLSIVFLALSLAFINLKGLFGRSWSQRLCMLFLVFGLLTAFSPLLVGLCVEAIDVLKRKK